MLWTKKIDAMITALSGDIDNDIQLGNARISREKISAAIHENASYQKLVEAIIDFAIVATATHKNHVHGEIVKSANGDKSIWWVLYQEDLGELVADAYLLADDLKYFATAPQKFVPGNARMRAVNIFGLWHRFLEDIAPDSARLFEYGAQKVWYYALMEYNTQNGKTVYYGRMDVTDKIKNLLNIAYNPVAMEEFKRKVKKEHNGVLDIEELRFFSKLQEISQKRVGIDK